MNDLPFHEKANRVLLIILFLILGLGFRVFQLSILQHDAYETLAKKPQRKAVIEPAFRGEIYDRKGQLLAYNKLSYRVGICYDEIRQIPRIKWEKEKKTYKKLFPRSDYVQKLSHDLASLLSLESQDVEDIIYSRAALFPHQVFILKEDLSEENYYQLKALEKDLPGLRAEIYSKRFYPEGLLGCHVLGYMGMIHQKEYDRLKVELNSLQDFLENHERGLPMPLPLGYSSYYEVKDRVGSLKEKAYQLNSMIGKAGIEGKFDELLRGNNGKKRSEVDIMGRIKRNLPDSKPAVPGQAISLSIDKDLQEYAEILLAQHEERRDKFFRLAGKNHHLIQGPWIKGGAIVALDPKSGQVLALASYPRFDPNDFSNGNQKGTQGKLSKWLELPSYFAKVWDGEMKLEKELYHPKEKKFYTISKTLTFESFIDYLLSTHSKVKKTLLSFSTLKKTQDFFKLIEEVSYFLPSCSPSLWIDFFYPDSPHLIASKEFDPLTKQYFQDLFLEHQAALEDIKLKLFPYFSSIVYNQDKLLLIDLLRLFFPKELINLSLPDELLNFSLNDWFEINQQVIQAEKNYKHSYRAYFHKTAFKSWREEYFKRYLKEKRSIEKKEKKSQKPYLDYLNEEEEFQFQSLYSLHKYAGLTRYLGAQNNFISPADESFLDESSAAYFSNHSSKPFKIFRELYKKLPEEIAKQLTLSFKSFTNLTDPLYGKYQFKSSTKSSTLKDLAMHFYPVTGFGFTKSYAFQEAAPQGSIFKIVTAYEGLRQHYLKEKTPPPDLNPLIVIDNSDGKLTGGHDQVLGFTQDGKKITRFYRGGKHPRSSKRCGKIGVQDALEMTSNLYFSVLAADLFSSPMDLTRAAKGFGYGRKTGIDLPGEISGIVPFDVLSNRTGLYALAIGQHSLVVTPLQTARMLAAVSNGGQLLKPQIVHHTNEKKPTSSQTNYPFESYYHLAGLDFPLFTASQNLKFEEQEHPYYKLVDQKLFFPQELQTYLLDGLRKVIMGEKGTARSSKMVFASKEYKDNYLSVREHMVGKTSSAEIMYHPCLDKEQAPVICKHIWFATTSFEEDKLLKKPNYKNPEVVIVVYLRFGNYGNEAAQIAGQMVKKFEELKNK